MITRRFGNVTTAGGANVSHQSGELTVTEEFIRVVPAVVLPVAPGTVPDAATVHTPPVALLTHTVGCRSRQEMMRGQITHVNKQRVAAAVLDRGAEVALTAVGLFLVRLVLAVGHAVTRQSVVDAVAVSTLELIQTVARRVEGCVSEADRKMHSGKTFSSFESFKSLISGFAYHYIMA